ncbi:MAG: ABC transporter permease [SAR202 cluster bacterium]|nr:ABC transporter permease [SAR202 cluster bacterium]
MRLLRLTLNQVRYENKAFWRSPAAAFFTFVFPLLFLFITNTIFGSGEMELPGGTASVSNFYVPAIIAFSAISTCYTNIAIRISYAREQGLLKRVRGTPLPSSAFFAGRIIHACLVAILLVIIIVVVGAVLYDVDVPTNTLPAFLLTLAVGAAALCALGLAISALIPNADASPAIVNASILPLLFASDIFIPLDNAPRWLQILGDVFPVKHFSEALQASFNPFETGYGFEGFALLVMAAWGVAGLLIAVRFFKWEPRH